MIFHWKSLYKLVSDEMNSSSLIHHLVALFRMNKPFIEYVSRWDVIFTQLHTQRHNTPLCLVRMCFWSQCHHNTAKKHEFHGQNHFYLNFSIVHFAHFKNFPFIFLVFSRETEEKRKEIKGTVFGVCKTNRKKIWQSKSISALEIHVSWLYYADIRIRDTFVYEYTPMPGGFLFKMATNEMNS